MAWRDVLGILRQHSGELLVENVRGGLYAEQIKHLRHVVAIAHFPVDAWQQHGFGQVGPHGVNKIRFGGHDRVRGGVIGSVVFRLHGRERDVGEPTDVYCRQDELAEGMRDVAREV